MMHQEWLPVGAILLNEENCYVIRLRYNGAPQDAYFMACTQLTYCPVEATVFRSYDTAIAMVIYLRGTPHYANPNLLIDVVPLAGTLEHAERS